MSDSLQCLSLQRSERTSQTTLALRLGGAGIILIVSAVASSFPSLAKREPRIAPPDILFFIGKHFGTGVILSTAFIHLMQEGFESLNNPCLSGGWKEWTGAVILFSFLAIFLVEYISTAYVEHLSPTHAEHRHIKLPSDNEHTPTHMPPYHDEPISDLLPDVEHSVEHVSVPSTDEPSTHGNHRHHPSGLDHKASPSRRSSFIGHHRHESPSAHQHKAGPRLAPRHRISTSHLSGEEVDELIRSPHSLGHGQEDVSRKTRIISILILQLGIMLHSIVIGLTLAITDGANFSTLLTALVFHQLFEGLSLGIRISTLPSGSHATRILPVILCILFAITAPVGVVLGIIFLPSPPKGISSGTFLVQGQVSTVTGGSMEAQTALLAQGLMCALSAGMLIYAAGVEMLAGDFVLDPEMRQLGFWKQALGLGSLILGTVAMGIVSMWVLASLASLVR
ncbi:ZIP zinc transporter-domain-containing protein [Gautieria morchelliformis]|nr:ZIP zinc transporter-domain-containing protein [Gautieria morchelliformis]